MVLRSGMNSSLGIATETPSYATYTAPTRWVPHVKAPLDHVIDRLESEGIMAGRRVLDADQWAPGNIAEKVPLEMELYDRSIGLFFTHMFGSMVDAGAGPFTHTATPGDLSGKSFTAQIGTPNTTDGTVHPFTLLGCKIPEWELGLEVGKTATLGLDVVAKSVTTAQSLAAVSYASGIGIGMTFVGASVTLAGSAYKTEKMSLKGKNGLNTDRRFIGDQTIDEPLETELREYTGMLASELFDLTAYNRFVNGTAAALVVSLARGTSTAVFTMNVRFDGDAPKVDGRDVVKNELPFKCIGDTDAGAITCVLTNGDTVA
jgi:hypothetical protein